MIIVTDKFTLSNDVYLPELGTEYSFTNIGLEPNKLLHSDDLITWFEVATLTSNQLIKHTINKPYYKVSNGSIYAHQNTSIGTHYRPSTSTSGTTASPYDDTALREQIEALKQKNTEQDLELHKTKDTLILPDNLALDFPDIPNETTAVYVANTGANFLVVQEDIDSLDPRESLILYKRTLDNSRHLKYQVECMELDLAKIGVQTVNAKVIDSAMYVASKYGYKIKLPCNATITYTEPLWIHEGILGIDGNGSTIYFNSGSKTSGLITANSQTGVANGKVAGGFFVKNLHVKALTEQDTGVYGFFGRDTSYVTLENCTFETVEKEPILFLINPESNGKELHYKNTTGHCKVFNCHVKYKNKNPNSYQANGIFFNVDLRPIIGTIGMDTWIKNQGTSFDGTFPKVPRLHEHCEVKRCIVEGSRYGIGGFYLVNSAIEHNTCYDNVRGIVLQNNSRLNVIKNNKVYNNSSSAILVNYGCNDNLIETNYLESDKAHGQSFLHTSVFCSDNIFKNNTAKFLLKDTSQVQANMIPMWGMYIGVGCTNVTFEDNHIEGLFRKALLAIESDWVLADTTTESYGSNMAKEARYPEKWANNKPTSNIIIRDNTFIQENLPSTVIFMKSNHGVALENISFTGNTVRAKNGYRLRVLGATKLVTGNNVYDTLDTKYEFGNQANYTAMLPDAGRALASWETNKQSNNISLIETGLVNGKFDAPTVNNASVFILQTGDQQFIGINGGIRGQIVHVRYAVSIEPTNTNELRLINSNANFSRINGNSASTFMCIANNIWLEISRTAF